MSRIVYSKKYEETKIGESRDYDLVIRESMTTASFKFEGIEITVTTLKCFKESASDLFEMIADSVAGTDSKHDGVFTFTFTEDMLSRHGGEDGLCLDVDIVRSITLSADYFDGTDDWWLMRCGPLDNWHMIDNVLTVNVTRTWAEAIRHYASLHESLWKTEIPYFELVLDIIKRDQDEQKRRQEIRRQRHGRV